MFDEPLRFHSIDCGDAIVIFLEEVHSSRQGALSVFEATCEDDTIAVKFIVLQRLSAFIYLLDRKACVDHVGR